MPASIISASHAFTFTNADGERGLVKYKAIPDAGELGLTDEEAASKGTNFYEEEMKERLGKGPVSFELVAIGGRDGDQTSDPTQRWDDEDGRETTPLGKISIEGLAPAATCDAFAFLPGNVTDGIAGPADDPIFQIRSAGLRRVVYPPAGPIAQIWSGYGPPALTERGRRQYLQPSAWHSLRLSANPAHSLIFQAQFAEQNQ